MLSIVLNQPGEFSAIDAAQPEPAAGEVLVRVRQIGICGTDIHAFAGRQPFFSYPRILGHELGVEVVESRAPGSDLRPGDLCSVEPYLNCGRCVACRRGKPNCCRELKVMGVHVDGGMRPFVAVPAAKLHRSRRLDLEQLALVETLSIGAHAVERAEIGRDDTVLVVGAGPIGLSVIQFVQETGARLVVMDTSEPRLAFCRDRLGVERTLNPLATPPADALPALLDGDMPTAVFDATGNTQSMHASFGLPTHGGKLVFVGLFQGDLTFNDPAFHRRELTVYASRNSLPATFERILRLIEAGRIDTKPWITHRLPLAEVPARFPTLIKEPGLLKGMIEVA